MLYHLGILEKQIKDHQAVIRKCTRKLNRSVGVTVEQKQRVKSELLHHQTELAKAEVEMTETKQEVDSQLRALFLIKLNKELVMQEEAVKAKETYAKKWQLILKKAEQEINAPAAEELVSRVKEGGKKTKKRLNNDNKYECASSSSTIDIPFVSDDELVLEEDEVDNTFCNGKESYCNCDAGDHICLREENSNHQGSISPR